MRCKTLLNSVMLAGTLGFTSFASAGYFEVGAGVPFYSLDFVDNDSVEVEDEIGFNLNLGYRIDNRVGLELSYSIIPTETSTTGADADIEDLSLNGLFYFKKYRGFEPFFLTGIGVVSSEIDGDSSDEREDSFNVGLGFKADLTNALQARFDTRWIHTTDFDNNHYLAMLGLNYRFGDLGRPAPKPAPVIAPEPVKEVVRVVDSDNDGVEDALDRCPTTGAGISVDSTGCPLDTDGDGVADYKDNCPNSAANLKVDAQGCAVVLTQPVSINLNVKFASNSSVVPAQYYGEIRKVADFMSQYANSVVTIEGHTDSQGAASYNKSLSQRRAAAVAQVLTSQFGVAASRVRSIGYGEERPIADNASADGRAQNRRVVAQVSAEKRVKQQR